MLIMCQSLLQAIYICYFSVPQPSPPCYYPPEKEKKKKQQTKKLHLFEFELNGSSP